MSPAMAKGALPPAEVDSAPLPEVAHSNLPKVQVHHEPEFVSDETNGLEVVPAEHVSEAKDKSWVKKYWKWITFGLLILVKV